MVDDGGRLYDARHTGGQRQPARFAGGIGQADQGQDGAADAIQYFELR